MSEIESKLNQYNIKLRLNKMIKTRNKTEATWDKNRQNSRKNALEYTWVQKGTDAKIVLDLIRDYYESDTDIFVLVSGDEDFAEVLGYLREKGKEVIILSFDRRDSKISDILAGIPNKMEILTYQKAIEIMLIT